MGIPGASSSVVGEVPGKRVLLAEPRGYCAGVDRAVETVERALEKHGAPVYVRHEIVHNRHVVDTLAKAGRGLRRRDRRGARGRHRGVLRPRCRADRARDRGRQRNLKVIDATCPLVTKVHNEAKRFARDDYDILLIGHEGHEEVVGTAGEAPDHVQLVDGPASVDNVVVRDLDKVIWLSQTTLSVDETMETVRRLRERFPTLQDPPSDDICYATQNRQVAVKAMAPECELVIVVGSRNSSNSVRLVEVALGAGSRCLLPGGLRRRHRPGLVLGASPRSASPPAHRCPRSWCVVCWTGWPSTAMASCSPSPPPTRHWCSPCLGRSAPRAHANGVRSVPWTRQPTAKSHPSRRSSARDPAGARRLQRLRRPAERHRARVSPTRSAAPTRPPPRR